MDNKLPTGFPNVYDPLCSSVQPDTSFRLDEGYAEDTRSIDDGDSAMGLEPRNSSTANLLDNPLLALHNAVMSLDERQRSGTHTTARTSSKTSQCKASNRL